MANLGTYITNFVTSNIVPLAAVAIFTVIVLIGMAFLVPGRKLKEWAKEHILFLVIGAAIVYSAASIASNLVTSF
ncbi:MAG: hypothetical protein RR869_08750 [Lachnospiraceae bacterium]